MKQATLCPATSASTGRRDPPLPPGRWRKPRTWRELMDAPRALIRWYDAWREVDRVDKPHKGVRYARLTGRAVLVAVETLDAFVVWETE